MTFKGLQQGRDPSTANSSTAKGSSCDFFIHDFYYFSLRKHLTNYLYCGRKI